MDTICTPEVVGPWVCEKAGGTWSAGRGTAIGRLENGKLTAGVLYEDYNGANILCHIRVDKPLNKHFLGLIFQYPFIQLKVNRITGIVPSCNWKALAFDQKLGFELEHVIKNAHPKGDLCILGMTKEKCRYLDSKYGDFFVKFR